MPRSLSCGAPPWYCPGIACNDEALADLRFDTLADSVRGLMARLRGG
jgi:hypothetical protein